MEYIEPLILMQYGGGRNISDLKKLREDKVLQKATGMRGIPLDSATGDWLLRAGEVGGTEGFRLIVLRWKEKTKKLSLLKSDGYYYHAIATDLDIEAERVIEAYGESIPEACTGVWRYSERVQMENLIKELKIGMGMEHMPCGKFEANAMYFSIKDNKDQQVYHI